MVRKHPSRSTRGFTLVELLVAMSLLSLVMLAMSSALRTMGQTESRIDARSSRLDDFRSATSFLRASLGRLVMRKRPPGGPADQSPYYFVGAPDAMAWIGIMPARFGVGGRYFFRLAAEGGGNEGAALTLRYTPWVPGQDFPDWSQAEGRVLVDHLQAFSIEYEDLRLAPGAWQPAWVMSSPNAVLNRQNQLPARVRLHVQTRELYWPDLIIPMRAVPSTAVGGGGGFAIGGGVDE